jgi:hypothetical protein
LCYFVLPNESIVDGITKPNHFKLSRFREPLEPTIRNRFTLSTPDLESPSSSHLVFLMAGGF